MSESQGSRSRNKSHLTSFCFFLVFVWCVVGCLCFLVFYVCLSLCFFGVFAFSPRKTHKNNTKQRRFPLTAHVAGRLERRTVFFSCFVVCFLLVGQKGYSARRGQTQYLDCVFTDFGNFSWIPKTGWPLVGNEGMNPHHNHV